METWKKVVLWLLFVVVMLGVMFVDFPTMFLTALAVGGTYGFIKGIREGFAEQRIARQVPPLEDEEEWEDLSMDDESEEIIRTHDVLGHILLWGPPGVGKSRLARVVSNRLEDFYGYKPNFVTITPAQIESKEELDEIMLSIHYGDVVFVDEIHGLDRKIEEALYSAIQDGEYHIVKERMPQTIELPNVTFVGATTLPGTINKPLRDRFSLEIELSPLEEEHVTSILTDQQKVQNPESFEHYRGQERAKEIIFMHMAAIGEEAEEIDQEAARLLASRAFGIPRIGKQLYRHAEALSIYREVFKITPEIVGETFEMLGIDELGLHRIDRRIINLLVGRDNQPLGQKSLAMAVGISMGDLADMVEPRLMQTGMLELTPRGRKLTPQAVEQFG